MISDVWYISVNRPILKRWSSLSWSRVPFFLRGQTFFVVVPFFLSGEGPRSRRYGRTAALWLIVQPYDEDEDDDYFLSFS
jgi:hypothetical protein